MENDDEQARRARSIRLREQIDRLKRGRDAEAPEAPPRGENPRAFVERRMREIDEEQQDED